MKKIFWLLLCSIPFVAFSQVSDSFEDGDFSNNPTWSSVNTSNWVIDNGRLRSNAQTTNTSFYISTPSASINKTQWQFFTQLQFNTSGANYVDVFLAADQENLSLVANGYFVRIGGTPDEISLYKIQQGISTILINGRNGSTNKSNNTISIKVKHTLDHEWTLERDTTGTGQVFFTEGKAIDSSISLSTHLGIRITQSTASFFNKHFFDNIQVQKMVSDTVGPTIKTITPLSRSSLLLNFNEKVTRESASDPFNYQLNNDTKCVTANLLDDEQSVELHFEKEFTNAADNILHMMNVRDLLGNKQDSISSTFFFFDQEPIERRDVIFSEILADPTPSRGLPEAEYIELYNRSNKVINTANLTFKDATTTIPLPPVYLYPSEYLLITSSSAANFFVTNSKVLGLPSFPNLTNAGERLTITDLMGKTIDSVTYSDLWYGDDEKKTGGYSLERMNQESTCLDDAENWLASKSETGGTPGKANSILDNSPDISPPTVQSIQVAANDLIEIAFSEKLKATSVITENFLIDPAKVIQSVSIDSTSLKLVKIKLDDILVPSQVYTLRIRDVSDCSGNITIDQNNENTFVLPEKAGLSDLVMTEILADPTPFVGLPAAEFVEIYNRSEKIIDLLDYQLSDASSKGILPHHLIFPKEYVVLVPDQSLNLFQGAYKSLGVRNFPTLNNGGELVLFKSAEGNTIDSVHYDLDWYRDDDKAEGGWSLERIDFDNFCLNSENWTASEDDSGGSPGRPNSVAASMSDQMGP